MPSNDETRDDSTGALDARTRAQPGLVFLMLAGEPSLVTLEVGPLGLELGRSVPSELLQADDRISRRHVRVRRARDGWVVADLDSRNGTYVGGHSLRTETTFAGEVLIRIGRTLIWAVDELAPFQQRAPRRPGDTGPVLGGRLQRAWSEIALASRAGSTLYVRGESGAGKELAAQAFHQARFGTGSKAPFVAVNCAAIPEGLAERLLFGAQRGAYSGATVDADGYVQAAHRGTLFLDEIAELDPLVQSKLLRVLEAREVLPLGATRPKSVEIAVCVASHKSLREEVGKSRFREDLYFRLGRPEVQLPPLRERLDELPWLIARELASVDPQLAAGVGFVEACALRPWPGNVRELLLEVRRAGHAALQERTTLLEPHHLAPEAGMLLVASGEPPTVKARAKPPSDDEIVRALDANAGNVRGTARALGIHRNQLRRWLEKRGQSADRQD